MTSRTDPPIGLARLRARGDLAELRASGPALLRRTRPAPCWPRRAWSSTWRRRVARLRQRTEGWAAGLYLAGLSLRGRDDAARFIADFAGDDRLVVDYLADEVLDGPAARAARLPAAHLDPRPPERARSATRSPGPAARRGCSPSSSARTSSSCRSTTAASGTATTTSSASCCSTSSTLTRARARSRSCTAARRPGILAEGSIDDAMRHSARGGRPRPGRRPDRRPLVGPPAPRLDHHGPALARAAAARDACAATCACAWPRRWLAINLGLPADADRWLVAAEAAGGPATTASWPPTPRGAVARAAAGGRRRGGPADRPRGARGHRRGRVLVARGRLPGRRHLAPRDGPDGRVVPDPRGVRRRGPPHRRLGARPGGALPPGRPGRAGPATCVAAERHAREALRLRRGRAPRRVPPRRRRPHRSGPGPRRPRRRSRPPRPSPTGATSSPTAGAPPPRSPTRSWCGARSRSRAATSALARACARETRALLDSAPAPGSHLAAELAELEAGLAASAPPRRPPRRRPAT